MEANNKTLVAFHIGRGGKHYNSGHKTFYGFNSIDEVRNAIGDNKWTFINREFYYDVANTLKKHPNLTKKLDKCKDEDDFSYFEKKFGFDFGKEIYIDCNGNEIGLDVENDGTGIMNFDGEYDTYYTRRLEDCDEHECELILADYFTSNEVQEFIYEKFDSLKPIEHETNE
jgi:hypothetical protein